MNELVLSLFPGIGLLDCPFRDAGFCVVCGPDLVTGGDIREFRGVPGRFDGIIGGPPCQGWSAFNRNRSDDSHPSVVNSRSMLREYLRVVDECRPTWFLIENVPAVPDVRIAGYEIQRLAISDRECGGVQIRNRHIQFGHVDGWKIRPDRPVNHRSNIGRKAQPVTTRPVSKWSNWPEHCRRQGIVNPPALPGWTRDAKFRAVGNGVPLPIGRVLAAAVKCAGPSRPDDCPCGCGRVLKGKQRAASTTCRKWLQLDRERARPFIDLDGYHPGRPLNESASLEPAAAGGQ